MDESNSDDAFVRFMCIRLLKENPFRRFSSFQGPLKSTNPEHLRALRQTFRPSPQLGTLYLRCQGQSFFYSHPSMLWGQNDTESMHWQLVERDKVGKKH